MTKASAPATPPTGRRTAAADNAYQREDLMLMCERLLEIYLRRLGLDGQPMTLDAAELARAGRARRRAPAPPADSCGARLRDGSLCLRPPVEGRWRCRSHGCAPHTGAPKGNSNALKHGRFTAAEIAKGRRLDEFIRECRETLGDVDKGMRRGV